LKSNDNSNCVNKTGSIHPIELAAQHMDFDGWEGFVDFREKTIRPMGTDCRHATVYVWKPTPEMKAGRDLVIQAGLHEFYIVGSHCRLFLCRKPNSDKLKAYQLVTKLMIKVYGYVVSVDEGHFNKKGEFIADRRRNVNEIFRRGLWVEADIGVRRVITCD
jgi:hypothetical protein